VEERQPIKFNSLLLPSPLGEGVCTLIGLTKSIEELFGKRRNNEAIMAILFAKLPLSEVDFDETVEVKPSLINTTTN
jgi:hypothetical protein